MIETFMWLPTAARRGSATCCSACRALSASGSRAAEYRARRDIGDGLNCKDSHTSPACCDFAQYCLYSKIKESRNANSELHIPSPREG
jgi:hypothetical protein